MLLIRVFITSESIEFDFTDHTVDVAWYVWISLGGEIRTDKLTRRRILIERVVAVGSTSFCVRVHDVIGR